MAALQRSLTESQVCRIAPSVIPIHECLLAINPTDSVGDRILDWLSSGKRKLLIFGTIPTSLKKYLDICDGEWPEPADVWSSSDTTATGNFSESRGSIQYTNSAKRLGALGWSRSLERYDFTDEWNNLGYGAIRTSDPVWGLSAPIKVPPSAELAYVAVNGENYASYTALFEKERSNILWINRSAGSIDSFEWRLVEKYIADWKWEDGAPCFPVVSEIPFGYDAAITMRLDCDEDIDSARHLWNLYKTFNIPLSLAIHTNNLPNATHEAFLKKFVSEGGALLSHTATHAPNWGGSYEAALVEALESRKKIEIATGVQVEYAVSPFHQTPAYALAALCDVGYRGCIGGIIRNDPEFLSARGGRIANLPQGFVGHSQQTMLHGDCMLLGNDRLEIYKRSFDKAYETKTLFGYLDHPFSSRYQYGWINEESRMDVHRDFIEYMRGKAKNPIFMNENQAMDFLLKRSAIRIVCSSRTCTVSGFPRDYGTYEFAVEYRGTMMKMVNGMVF